MSESFSDIHWIEVLVVARRSQFSLVKFSKGCYKLCCINHNSTYKIGKNSHACMCESYFLCFLWTMIAIQMDFQTPGTTIRIFTFLGNINLCYFITWKKIKHLLSTSLNFLILETCYPNEFTFSVTVLLVDQNQNVKLRPTGILKFYVKCEINTFAHKIFHLSLHLLSLDKAIIFEWF